MARADRAALRQRNPPVAEHAVFPRDRIPAAVLCPEIFGQVGHVEQLVGEFERVVVGAHDDVRAGAYVSGDCRLGTNVVPAFGVNSYFNAGLLGELLGVGDKTVELRLDELLPAQHSELRARFGSGAVPGRSCLRRTQSRDSCRDRRSARL
jgi:hypothetical protein